MTSEKTDEFEKHLKQLLDQSIDGLDQQTLANLNQTRHYALNKPLQKKTRRFWKQWSPIGYIATAAIVAAFWLGNPSVVPTDAMDDFELLTTEEDLALMEEIEFIAWLMEQEHDSAG